MSTELDEVKAWLAALPSTVSYEEVAAQLKKFSAEQMKIVLTDPRWSEWAQTHCDMILSSF